MGRLSIDDLYGLLTNNLDIPIYHFVSEDNNKTIPYVVYSEYQKTFFRADNRISSEMTHFQLHLYTYKDYRVLQQKIKRLLDENFVLKDISIVQAEPDDKNNIILHHVFDCEVI